MGGRTRSRHRLLAQFALIRYPFHDVNGAGPGRCPLLGRVARSQAIHRLPQELPALYERVRLPGVAHTGDSQILHRSRRPQHDLVHDGAPPAGQPRQRVDHRPDDRNLPNAQGFCGLVYLSLVLQAEGIRYGVEHWRRHMHRVSGTLYWQLNDCWPVASWASIDYFGRWKALHYAARRFYAPLLLSVEDKPPVMDIHLSSDLTESWQGTLKWSLETLAGEAVDTGSMEVTGHPLEDTLIKSFDFRDLVNKENERQLVFTCQLWKGDAFITTSMATFVPNKHLSFVDPKLKIATNQEGDKLVIVVTAESLARFIELKLTGADIIFSDNYFDVPAGRTVRVSCPIPEGWSTEGAEKCLERLLTLRFFYLKYRIEYPH